MNFRILLIPAILSLATLGACTRTGGVGTELHFDGSAAGTIPAGWNVAATHMRPKLATWETVKEADATTLDLTKPNHDDRRTFNLLWSDEVDFRDGELSVRIRANSGVIDQGGGLIWRVQDSDNYYLTRYNPLETNLRLYHVVDGVRTQIADVPDLRIPTGQWFTLDVSHYKDHIIVSLDGKPLIDSRDRTIDAWGGVGLWTKADAATSFDDLVVRAR